MLNFKLIIRLLSLFNYFKLLEFDSVTLACWSELNATSVRSWVDLTFLFKYHLILRS